MLSIQQAVSRAIKRVDGGKSDEDSVGVAIQLCTSYISTDSNGELNGQSANQS